MIFANATSLNIKATIKVRVYEDCKRLMSFNHFRRNRQKHKAYLHKRAMSSINGYESSKLQFHDESLDDDPNEPSTFVIPRPQVTGQFEMQRTNSDVALVEDDKSAAKVFD